MKYLAKNTLFITLLFSAMVPAVVRAAEMNNQPDSSGNIAWEVRGDFCDDMAYRLEKRNQENVQGFVVPSTASAKKLIEVKLDGTVSLKMDTSFQEEDFTLVSGRKNVLSFQRANKNHKRKIHILDKEEAQKYFYSRKKLKNKETIAARFFHSNVGITEVALTYLVSKGKRTKKLSINRQNNYS